MPEPREWPSCSGPNIIVKIRHRELFLYAGSCALWRSWSSKRSHRSKRSTTLTTRQNTSTQANVREHRSPNTLTSLQRSTSLVESLDNNQSYHTVMKSNSSVLPRGVDAWGQVAIRAILLTFSLPTGQWSGGRHPLQRGVLLVMGRNFGKHWVMLTEHLAASTVRSE
jgi:hypothetical protein